MVDLTKIQVIHDWARRTSPINILSFIDLASYNWCFVEGFYSIETPLTKLSQKKIFFSGQILVR